MTGRPIACMVQFLAAGCCTTTPPAVNRITLDDAGVVQVLAQDGDGGLVARDWLGDAEPEQNDCVLHLTAHDGWRCGSRSVPGDDLEYVDAGDGSVLGHWRERARP